MKIAIGLFVGFLIGAGCRFFDIPAPSPPVLPGAFLVVAMTLGYTTTDRLLSRKGDSAATTKHLCGGPTGITVASNANAKAGAGPDGPSMNQKLDYAPSSGAVAQASSSEETVSR